MLNITTYPALFGETSGSEVFNTGISEMGIDVNKIPMDVFCLNDGNKSVVEWSPILVEAAIRKFRQLPPGSIIMTHISEHLQAIRILRSRGQMITPFYYTHSPYDCVPEDSPGNFFSSEHRARTQWLMRQPEVVVGTQTETNAKYLRTVGIEVEVLPPYLWSNPPAIPSTNSVGVLWGTHYDPKNDRKGFEQFIDDYGGGHCLRILVQKEAEQDVKAYLKKKNIYNFDLRAGISGKEKDAFIRGSACGVCYSKSESFGLFMAEMASVIPVYCPEYYPWMAEFGVPIKGGWTKPFNISEHNNKTVKIWESFRRAYGF